MEDGGWRRLRKRKKEEEKKEEEDNIATQHATSGRQSYKGKAQTYALALAVLFFFTGSHNIWIPSFTAKHNTKLGESDYNKSMYSYAWPIRCIFWHGHIENKSFSRHFSQNQMNLPHRSGANCTYVIIIRNTSIQSSCGYTMWTKPLAKAPST